MKYGSPIREAVLRRILPPNSESMSQVSRDTGISLQTLMNWKNQAIASGQTVSEEKETSKLSSKERFFLVAATLPMNESELGEFARSKGVFVEELKQWREIYENAYDLHNFIRAQFVKIIKEKDKKIRELTKDVDKKDKALAEICALEILRKKGRAIWGDPEGE